MPEEVELRVGEIPKPSQKDIGRGIVRIDASTMEKLGISPGDIVEIEGKRVSVAIADRAYPSDVGLGIIRMDGLVRSNTGATIGEMVKVRKANYSNAKKVTIAPTETRLPANLPLDAVARILIGRPLIKGDVIQLRGISRYDAMGPPFEQFFNFIGPGTDLFFSMGDTKFVVVSTSPPGVVRVTDETRIEILPEPVEIESERIPEVTYEDIGGLSKEVRMVREMIELPLKHPELFERLGIDPPKGVLLYGPPGTGKTLLAKAVANESNANFIAINGPEIMSKFVGDAEKKIRDVFEEAQKNAPTIIFIDEIDAIAPKREEVVGGVEGRVVAQILASMDGLKSRGQVIVIAATNRENAVDPALRRVGRFDREIEIGVPDKKGRKEILQIHTRNMPLTDDVDLDKLAAVTHGFVGADLQGLCKEAAMSALRRILPEINIDDEGRLPKEILEKLTVCEGDFRNALRIVRPSAMREVLVEVPNIRWDDIGGYDDIKQELKEAIEWPLKYRKSFERLHIRPPKGILLYGPPGTGKTLLAKAVATESEANFISIKGPEVLSKWVGESEKAIREIFRKARQVAPCIVFFDEIDAIATSRGYETGTKVTERVVNQLLTELDGLEDLQDVVIIGATNRPDIIDAGLLRAGRFDRRIMVGPPDENTRRKILEVHTRNMPLDENVDINELAKKTENYVGADIEAVCREAAMLALREDIDASKVELRHFNAALEKVAPSMNEKVIKFYEMVEHQFKAPAVQQQQQEPPSYMR